MFQAIPAGVLQSYIFIASTVDERSAMALVSIFCSASSTALMATSISYDTDISPIKRKQNPLFYGYVPNLGRGKVFSLMLLSNTCHVINKFLSCGLLCATNPSWLLSYLVGDLGLFLLVKIIACDFWTW